LGQIEIKTNSAQLELELGLSLAKLHSCDIDGIIAMIQKGPTHKNRISTFVSIRYFVNIIYRKGDNRI
jgi:hypothetical protein